MSLHFRIHMDRIRVKLVERCSGDRIELVTGMELTARRRKAAGVVLDRGQSPSVRAYLVSGIRSPTHPHLQASENGSETACRRKFVNSPVHRPLNQ